MQHYKKYVNLFITIYFILFFNNLAWGADFINAFNGNSRSLPVNTIVGSDLTVDVISNGSPARNTRILFSGPTDPMFPGATFTTTNPAITNSSGFTGMRIKSNTKAGTYTITATAIDLGNITTTFNITNLAGPATFLTASSTSTPQSAIVAQNFIPLQVNVTDQFSNPINGAIIAFSAPGTGASASLLPNPSATTDASGNASINAIANTNSGAYNVIASVNSLSTAFHLTNLAGAANSIVVTPGSTPQTAQINEAFVNPLEVEVRDIYGNPVTNQNITFRAPLTGASADLTPLIPVVATNSSGRASVSATANPTIGNYDVIASVNSSLSTNFNLTNLVGDPSSIVANSGSGQSTTINQSFAVPLTVTVFDSSGNPDPNQTVTFTATGVGADATFTSPNPIATDAFGRASVTLIAGSTDGGPYNVTATVIGSGITPATFSLTNLPNPSITTTTLPALKVGSPVNIPIISTGGTGPFIFSVSSGALPVGLHLDINTGLITGMPSIAGAYSFAITVTDAAGASISTTFSGIIVGLDIVKDNPPPNPTQDQAVSGIIDSNASATYRFSEAQIQNIMTYLEQNHSFFDQNNAYQDSSFKGLSIMGMSVDSVANGNIGEIFNAINNNFSDSNKAIIKPINNVNSPREGNKLNQSGQMAKKILPLGSGFIWIAGNIGYGSQESTDDAKNKFSSSGLTFGINYKLNNRLMIGAAGGYGFDKSRIDHYGSHNNANNISGSLYGAYKIMDNTYIDGLLGYGNLRFKNRRWFISDQTYIYGKRKGHNLFGSLSLTHEKYYNSLKIAYFVKGDFVHGQLDKYKEIGDSNFLLAYNKMKSNTGVLGLGIRGSYDVKFNSDILTPVFKLEYQNAIHTKSKQELTYINITSDVYKFNATSAPKNTINTMLGLRYVSENGVASQISYDYSRGSKSYFEHSGKAVVSILF